MSNIKGIIRWCFTKMLKYNGIMNGAKIIPGAGSLKIYAVVRAVGIYSPANASVTRQISGKTIPEISESKILIENSDNNR